VVARQAEQVCLSFAPVARFQIAVTRQGQRDGMTLKVELKHALSGEEKQKLSDELSQKFQDICRIKPDRIELVAEGNISEEQPKIVDERTWK
jgi:phenylacetate-coenzyme A ligase PaaK-like adenylate-forming protein